MHEANGVPMEIVIDDEGGILEVETFGQYVGADENVDRVLKILVKLCLPEKVGSLIVAVIIRGKAFDHDLTVYLTRAINLLDPFETCIYQLLMQIAGSVSVFGEDCDFLTFENSVFFEVFEELLKLIITGRVFFIHFFSFHIEPTVNFTEEVR